MIVIPFSSSLCCVCMRFSPPRCRQREVSGSSACVAWACTAVVDRISEDNPVRDNGGDDTHQHVSSDDTHHSIYYWDHSPKHLRNLGDDQMIMWPTSWGSSSFSASRLLMLSCLFLLGILVIQMWWNELKAWVELRSDERAAAAATVTDTVTSVEVIYFFI